VKYCSRCVMPDTKPGVYLDENGVCSACVSVEKKRHIDWDARRVELKQLCDSIRGTNGNGYDCLVSMSGGKDSQYQVWMMKMVHKMNILGVCVVPHLQTEEGIANLNTTVSAYNIDFIKLSLRPSVLKRMRRRAFFEMGEPNWADHCGVFAGVARVAYMYRVPMVVWGEDIAVEFGGKASNKSVASAEDLIRNDLIKDKTVESFFDDVISAKNTVFYHHPRKDELQEKNLKSIYLGYYDDWDGQKHYEVVKQFGFKSRKQGPLSGNIIDYDNIDEKLCEINIWFKFLKFGFWRPTDQCCYQIWNQRMTRAEAVKLVNQKQYEFPKEYLREFLEYHSITEKEFWEVAEKFRNKDIWHKVKGEWRLKVPLV